MPKFFIDVRDAGGIANDDEGSEFAHVEDALNEAKASACDLVRQYMDNQIPLTATCVEVRDTQGRTVAALTIAELLEHPVHPEFKSECSDLPRHGHRLAILK
jgi:hypothetical protein